MDQIKKDRVRMYQHEIIHLRELDYKQCVDVMLKGKDELYVLFDNRTYDQVTNLKDLNCYNEWGFTLLTDLKNLDYIPYAKHEKAQAQKGVILNHLTTK